MIGYSRKPSEYFKGTFGDVMDRRTFEKGKLASGSFTVVKDGYRVASRVLGWPKKEMPLQGSPNSSRHQAYGESTRIWYRVK